MGTVLPIRPSTSRLLRDVATTYIGLLVNAVLGFVTLTLMAKQLGPGAFGLATLANTLMAVVAGLGETGAGTALVRLAARPGMTAEALDRLVVAAIQVKLAV